MTNLALLILAAYATDPAPTESAPSETSVESEGSETKGSETDEAVAPVVEAAAAVPPRHPAFPDAPELAGQVTVDSPHYDLEELYTAGSHAEGLALARERLAASPDDPDLVWMIVRFQFQILEALDPADTSVDKEAIYGELVELTDAAMQAHPGHPHLSFARGLARGRLGTTRGVLASLFMAKDIEADWLSATGSGYEYSSIWGSERMPCDVDLGLAIFYRLVPDWWIVKALAGTRGDLEKSLAFAQKANDCAPNVIRNLKELGVTEICLGGRNKDEAMIASGRAHVQEYTSLTPRTNTEHVDMAHADKILAMTPKEACEYSRDGQQDLDRKNLE